MSQALYRKWRPRQWDEVIGQEHVIQTLRNAVAGERVAHAYLFSGPRGTGKTTTARLLAKAVNCLDADPAKRPCGECEHCQSLNAGHFLDLIEIDAASNTSVEDVRDLRDKINFSPNQGRYKVYIIDEVHMLSTAAFNALLKTLEEPPPHAIFILATTEEHKIPATVLSRCQRHEFRRIPVAEIVAYLKELAKNEAIAVEPEALNLVARQSTGSMRDAISLLDQLASSGQKITLEQAQNVLGTATNQAVLQVVDALLERQAASGLDRIHQALDSGSDPRQLARQLVDYLRDLLLVRMQSAGQIDASAERRAQMARHAQALDTSELLRMIRIFNQAANDARSAWQPALPLEMAFVEALVPPAEGEATTTQEGPAQAGAQPTRPAKAHPAKKAAGRAKGEAQGQPGATTGEEVDEEEEDQTADAAGTNQLMQNWRRILGTVRQQNPNTYGLLNSCRAKNMRNGTLVLDFASDLLKSKMEKEENVRVVQEALKQVLGEEIDVRCRTRSSMRTQLPPNVDSDGMVATAINDLGGEIVDIQ
jgi:DNA polymerase-3 subunit gamma/tau